MEIQISELQRRASIAALSAPSRPDTYAGCSADPNQWIPPTNPYYDEDGELRKPARALVYQMAHAYVNYHLRPVYRYVISNLSPKEAKKFLNELADTVVEDWEYAVGDIRGIDAPNVFSNAAIDDLQTGYKPEQLPLTKVDPPTMRPWHWRPPGDEPEVFNYMHNPLSLEQFDEFGEEYIALEQETSDYNRLQRLLDWRDDLHTITDERQIKHNIDEPEFGYPDDVVTYENNYSALIKGGRTEWPQLD